MKRFILSLAALFVLAVPAFSQSINALTKYEPGELSRLNSAIPAGPNRYFVTGYDSLGTGALVKVDAFPRTSLSADRGDANVTLVSGVDAQIQLFKTALTANRTVTLSTTGATAGDRFRIVRTGLGSFTLAVGSAKTIASATAAFVDVAFDGTAWVLIGYGAL